jgi:hypothetical protein
MLGSKWSLGCELADGLGAARFQPTQDLDQDSSMAMAGRAAKSQCSSLQERRLTASPENGHENLEPRGLAGTPDEDHRPVGLDHAAGGLDTLTLVSQDYHLVAREKPSWSSNATNSDSWTSVSQDFDYGAGR